MKGVMQKEGKNFDQQAVAASCFRHLKTQTSSENSRVCTKNASRQKTAHS